MDEKVYYVYILTNKLNSVLYIGVTNNLEHRVYQHKEGKGSQFTKKYKCNKLIYYEEYKYINEAIAREKELKGWSRKKKEILINKINSLWSDLGADWLK